MAPRLLRSNPPAFGLPLATRATAGLLCLLLGTPVNLLAAAHSAKRPQHTPLQEQLTSEQKTLQALYRFTFGPRPGDQAAVDRMGLDAWFARQLHPELISDTGLDARLAKYPAMRLPQAELVEHYPTPEMLRRYSRGNLSVPEDAVERAIYADAAWNYEEKVSEKKAAQAAAATAPGSEMGAGMMPREAGSGRMPQAGGASESGSAAPVVRRGPLGDKPVDPATAAEPMVSATGPMAPKNDPALEVTKRALLQLPAEARWERLVSLPPDQMHDLQASFRGPEGDRVYAGMTPVQAEQVMAMRSPERLIQAEVTSQRLLRDVYSERQLQAVMADFWLNHFSVYLHKNQNEPYLLPAYERDAILPNALGSFEDLLVATAKSPAMLVYLDNWESVGPDSQFARRTATAQQNRIGPPPKKATKTLQGINENYARELMELHTLGVNGGYTQQDVIEVAKCFSGWTIDRPAQGGEFLFNPNRHEPGDKTVLGHVIHEGGMNEGLEVLHLLATSPATAHFVSLKLAQRFVSDTPPPALVDRMAASFRKSSGDLKVVLTTMFRSPEFWSPAVYRSKVKTPLEFVASALRATDAEVINPLPIVQALDRLGMPIFGMQTPNGYSWQAESWVSSNALLTRMNFALVLAGNRFGGTVISWPEVLGTSLDAGTLPDEVAEDRLERVLLGQPAASKTRDAALHGAVVPGVQDQAEQSFRSTPITSAKSPAPGGMLRVKAGRAPVVTTPETPLATTAGLLLGSPDFQRR